VAVSSDSDDILSSNYYDRAVATRAGAWGSGKDGLTFVPADELLAAARKSGRVITTAEFLKRQRELIATMPPLAQAKTAILMRQFDVAREILDRARRGETDRAEAILLLGYMNDIWCANRPQEAMKFYEELAQWTSNPDATLTGMYYRFRLLAHRRRWGRRWP
jgi:hypothetical protein